MIWHKYLRPNLYDYLKVIAIITMIIDHIGYLYFPDALALRLIGRVALPLFLFLVGVNGSYGSRWMLWLMVCIVQVPFLIAIEWWWVALAYGNILLSIALVRVLLSSLQRYVRDYYWSLAVLFCLVVGSLILFPWSLEWFDGGMGPLLFALRWYVIVRYPRQYRLHIVMAWVSLVSSYLIQEHVFGFSLFQMNWLAVIYGLLAVVCFRVGYVNDVMQIWKRWWSRMLWRDRLILLISRYALRIYLIHGLLLVGWLVLYSLIYI